MKYALFLLMPLFCLSCDRTSQNATDSDYSEEVIITGKILNREVYPKEKELTLIVPFFRDQETKHVVPIADDNTFSFRFSPYAKYRNVVIDKFADHLFVSPGDSLHVEIDFKNLLNPKISGDADKRNQQISTFVQSGRYYIKDYSIRRNLEPTEFETTLQQEYNDRQARRQEFLEKFEPDEEVKQYTEKLLKIDYYNILLDYLNAQMYQGKDVTSYKDILSEIDPIFEGEAVPSTIFELAEGANGFISYKLYTENKKGPTFEDFIAYPVGRNLKQYVYASSISSSLMANDTTLFSSRQEEFDSIVHIPALNKVLHVLFQDKQDYLKNPQKVSDYMLYGNYADMPELKEKMDFMTPIYQILEKHKGKVVYLDFWTTSCSPCLAEIKPLKELRKKYSVNDIVMVNIAGGPRDRWEEILKRFDLRQPGIECLYMEDISDTDSFMKLLNQIQLKGYPHYILFNRNGVVIDYGTMVRPSFPQTRDKIDSLLK